MVKLKKYLFSENLVVLTSNGLFCYKKENSIQPTVMHYNVLTLKFRKSLFYINKTSMLMM